MNSTPRTPLSPQDALASVQASVSHRSNSVVRFQGLQAPAGYEDQSRLGRKLSNTDLSPGNFDQCDTAKMSSQLQSHLLDRINSLESQLHNFELSRHPGSSEKGDESSERTGLSTEIQWMTWQEYLEDASKASHILEVLVEKPHTNNRRKLPIVPPIVEYPQKSFTRLPSSPHRNIERIRIRSFHIINALQVITEQTFSSSSRLILHRPFKVLLFYHEQIADYLMELEQDFTKNTQCPLEERCHGFVQIGGEESDVHNPQHTRRTSIRRSHDRRPKFELSRSPGSVGGDEKECKHELSEELLAQAEAITHLRILTKFMREDMKEIFAKHELLRSSQATTIAFQDLWHLFMAGDLVVAEDECTGRGLELYQVSILPACDSFSSRRPVKQIQTKTEGSHQLVESVYKEEPLSAMSVFTVDVFYFDFDGQKFGPVERRMQLVSYEGEKNILDLPLYPLRLRKDSSKFKAMMLGRGMKFRELSTTNEYPHREYNGLSVGEPQEQVRQPTRRYKGHQTDFLESCRLTVKSLLTSLWRTGNIQRMLLNLDLGLGLRMMQG